MNTISSKQNEPEQLRRLAAQRYLYSFSKRIFVVQLVLAGPIAIGWAFAVILRPELKSAAALSGVLVALADLLLLTPWQKSLNGCAARIQEAFDCDVLELPWNRIKVGERPDAELVKEQADAYQKIAPQFPPLLNWYPAIVSELPINVARVICQRANCWWDSKQRRRYAVFVFVGAGLIVAAISTLAVAGGLTVDELLVAVIAPLAPTLVLAFRQATEHAEAATRLDKLKTHSDRLWNEATEQASGCNVVAETRALQDEIFENRKRSPFIFDWIFARFRNSYEAQMNHGAVELVAQARARLNEKPN